jgi:hypothetical protein
VTDSRGRTVFEVWLLQSIFFGRENWWPVLQRVLTLADFRDPLNFLAFRAILLADGDFVEAAMILRRGARANVWQGFLDRFCGGFDIFHVVGDPPVDHVLPAMKADDLAKLNEIAAALDLLADWNLYLQELPLGPAREVQRLRT